MPAQKGMPQLAFALGVAAAGEGAADEELLDVLLAAAFPSPDDLLSLEVLLSEPSDLDVLALLALSSVPLLEPGLL